MKTEDMVFVLFCLVALIGLAVFVSALPTTGPTEANYSQVRGGMNVAEVSDILGEGDIYSYDNHGMVSMKYTGEGVRIYVIFIDGTVYKKTIKQGDVIPDGEYLFPEIEL
jgi:hypothetical protein